MRCAQLINPFFTTVEYLFDVLGCLMQRHVAVKPEGELALTVTGSYPKKNTPDASLGYRHYRKRFFKFEAFLQLLMRTKKIRDIHWPVFYMQTKVKINTFFI